MQRLKDYSRFIVWQTGLGYLLLWAVTYWTLDQGGAVFGKSGACYPDAAKVLFYWVCDGGGPLAVLASVSNAALTATVWAPVYPAAATVRPDAAAIAAPIVALHVVGLPLAIFVVMRILLAALDLRRVVGSPRASTAAASVALGPIAPGPVAPEPDRPVPVSARRPVPPRPALAVKPRNQFGLRRMEGGRRRTAGRRVRRSCGLSPARATARSCRRHSP
jgi:hypothetical protein